MSIIESLKSYIDPISLIFISILIVTSFHVGHDYGYKTGYSEGYKEADTIWRNYSERDLEAKIISGVYNFTMGNSCKNLNTYQPIISQVLRNPPQISDKSVCLNFRNGGTVFYQRLGGLTRSMSPTIEPGYIVIYQEKPEEVKIGDIIGIPANKCNGSEGSYEIWVHRVIYIDNINGTLYYKTKGDNNQRFDECNITNQDVKYRVTAILPSTLY